MQPNSSGLIAGTLSLDSILTVVFDGQKSVGPTILLFMTGLIAMLVGASFLFTKFYLRYRTKELKN